MFKERKVISALLATWLIAAQAFAATGEEIGAAPAFVLEEMVVTATKTPVAVREVSADVAVITQEEIKAQNARTLRDIIGSAAGVGIMRANGRAALSIRGFDSRYSMILMDGRRIPAEPDANYELDRISLDNVERIEIVRGPVTSLYGADALGGVVNIITKASTQKAWHLDLDQGLWTDKGDWQGRYAFSYDSGRQNKLSVFLAGNYTDTAESLKGDGTTFLPFGKRRNISGRVDYFPRDGELISLSASYMEEKQEEYASMQSLMGTLATAVRDDNNRTYYGVSYKKTLTNGELFVNAYQTIWDKYNDTVNRGNGLYLNSVYGYYRIAGIEARVSKAAGPDHRLTIGGEFRPELYRGTGIRTGRGTFTKTFHGKTYQGSEVKTDYSALYVQDEWDMAPKLSVTTAARYDGSDRFADKVSPKLGLTYRPEPGWRIKANTGKGYRVPSPNQLFLDLNVVRNGALVKLAGNNDLKPESSTFYDLAVERDWSQATGKLTFFSSKVRDMIDEAWVSAAHIEYQNIGRASLRGLEGEITCPLTDRLSWSGNYTYLDAGNDLTGTRLFNRARHKVSSRFSYRPEPDLSASIWVDAYRDYLFQQSSGSGVNKSFAVWNMNVTKKINENQTIAVGVENLFNHQDEELSLPGTFVHMNVRFTL